MGSLRCPCNRCPSFFRYKANYLSVFSQREEDLFTGLSHDGLGWQHWMSQDLYLLIFENLLVSFKSVNRAGILFPTLSCLFLFGCEDPVCRRWVVLIYKWWSVVYTNFRETFQAYNLFNVIGILFIFLAG